MTDENAFGLLLSWWTIEEEEYSGEPEAFAARLGELRAVFREALRELPLGEGVQALDLGHALYVEVADGDHRESPLGWLRSARERLLSRGFETVALATYGGRWVDPTEGSSLGVERLGAVSLATVARSSEPLRRALAVDAFSRDDGAGPPDEDADEDADPEGAEPAGWGPGLYIDDDALEPLGMRLRNVPTGLFASGGRFYRIAR